MKLPEMRRTDRATGLRQLSDSEPIDSDLNKRVAIVGAGRRSPVQAGAWSGLGGAGGPEPLFAGPQAAGRTPAQRPMMAMAAAMRRPTPLALPRRRGRNRDWLRSRAAGQAAISKAAISTAADLRETLAAGGVGAS